MIDLDDEDEIDDVEKDGDKQAEVIDLETPKKSGESAKRSLDDTEEGDAKKAKANLDEEEEEEKE